YNDSFVIHVFMICINNIKMKGEDEVIMKSTGMVRTVDELGRVVIPIELRRSLGIKEKDPVEIYIEEDEIILKKDVEQNVCQITGEATAENIALADGKLVLSPEGAKELVKEIEKHFSTK